MNHGRNAMNAKRPVVIAIGLCLLFTVSSLRAQELTWQEVGDIPINAFDFQFDDNGSLWAIITELYRLESGSQTWQEIADESNRSLLVIGPDTVLHAGGNVKRSTDGGENWQSVWDEGGALFESTLDGPNAGVLLTGVRDSSGVGYSLDRGATWQRATFAVPEVFNRECYAFLELPPGHSYEGRLLAGCLGGLAYSDDSGRVWNYTNAWWTFQTEGSSLAMGPDDTVYAISGDGPGPGGFFVWASADGATWEQRAALPGKGFLVVLPNPAPVGSLIAVPVFESEGAGVYGSTDGGQSWSLLGRTPVDPTQDFVEDALLDPDGLLYIAISRAGPEDAWVYRTTEAVVVANEASVTEPTSESFVTVYPNPAANRISVQGIDPGTEITLYDMLGRAVLRSITPLSVDVSALPPGVYVVRAGGESLLIAIRR